MYYDMTHFCLYDMTHICHRSVAFHIFGTNIGPLGEQQLGRFWVASFACPMQRCPAKG